MTGDEIHEIIMEAGLNEHGLLVFVLAMDPKTKAVAWASCIPRGEASILLVRAMEEVLQKIST